MDARAFGVVALGAAIGGCLRFLIASVAQARLGQPPWVATGAINISGSLAIGAVLGWLLRDPSASPYLRLFLATGILGGFTTFSSFSVETLELLARPTRWLGVAYAGGSVALGVAAAGLGAWLVRLVAR